MNQIKPKIHLRANTTVTPHHVPIVPLKAISQAINEKLTSETLLEIEKNPFLTIELSKLGLVPTLQRLDSKVPHLHGSVMEPQR